MVCDRAGQQSGKRSSKLFHRASVSCGMAWAPKWLMRAVRAIRDTMVWGQGSRVTDTMVWGQGSRVTVTMVWGQGSRVTTVFRSINIGGLPAATMQADALVLQSTFLVPYHVCLTLSFSALPCARPQQLRDRLDTFRHALAAHGHVSAQQSDSPSKHAYSERYTAPFLNLSAAEWGRLKDLPFCAGGLQGAWGWETWPDRQSCGIV